MWGLWNFDGTFKNKVGRTFQSDILEAGSGSSKANLKPISASRKKAHRRCGVVQRGVNQSGRGHARCRKPAFRLPHRVRRCGWLFSGFNFFDKIGVCPVWLKRGMISDLRPPILHRRRFDIVHERHHMRHPGINGMGREFHATDIECPSQDKVMRADSSPA